MAGVRTKVDVGRLAAAVKRPGVDPRVWLSLAVVKDVAFDPDNGIFADVQLQPTGEAETCLVASTYAGAGFGAWFPLEVDDVVLVAIPSGDPGAGPVIIARMWSASDKPHADFGDGEDPTADVVVRPKSGQRVVIRTSDADVSVKVEGSADVVLEVQGGKVRLGAESGLEPAVLGATLKVWLDQIKLALDAHTHTAVTAGAGVSGPPAPLTFPDVPAIEAAKVEVI